MFCTALMTMYCSFDVAGRSWVKLKKYQKSMKEQQSTTLSAGTSSKGSKYEVGIPQGAEDSLKPVKKKIQYKRSGSNPNRSWRHR